MIRPATCVCMLLAAGSGLYLYQTKHRAQMLDREIVQTLKQADAVRERIGVLRGEWALLNEPERLAELSRQHLGLQTLAPTQFASLAELPNRLPAPLPPGTALPEPEEPEDAPALVAAAPAPPRQTPPPAARVAVATPPPAPLPAALAPTLAPAPASLPRKPAAVASAQPTLPPPVPVRSAPSQAAARPAPGLGDGVVHAARALPPPEPRAEPRMEPRSAIVRASSDAPQPAFASALGGLRSALPPPVPYGAAQAPYLNGR